MYYQQLHNNVFIRNAINLAFVKKLKADSYCDISKYINNKMNKEEQKVVLSNIDSPYIQVVKNRNSKTIDEYIKYLNKFLISKSYKQSNSDPSQMREEEIYTIIMSLFSLLMDQDNRETRINLIMNLIKSELNQSNIDKVLDLKEDIIYFSNIVEINFVDSINSFSELIKIFGLSNECNFFRGQSNVNYILQPSIMRTKGFIENERKMYNELLISSPEYFENQKSHLEVLVEMQHYGLPTRLLDITNNPLVALYFACNDNNNKHGEVVVFSQSESKIRYSQSDTVTILASLPLFKYNEQKEMYEDANNSGITSEKFNNKYQRLLHEVKTEKPAFRDKIKKEDLLNSIIVLPLKKNKRIIKQDGAFVICGLSNGNQNLYLNRLRYVKVDKHNKIQIFIVSNKADILAELNSFSINRATLFPEIDTVAEHIKSKYIHSIK